MRLNIFIVHEYEFAILFRNGIRDSTLPAGKTIRWGSNYALVRFDSRVQMTSVPSHELTCADGVTIRAGVRVGWRIVDPIVALQSAATSIDGAYELASYYGQSYSNIGSFSILSAGVYAIAHQAIRDAVGQLTHEVAMENRSALSTSLAETIPPQLAEIGIELHSATAVDFGLSGEIKRAYARSVVARKEAEASIERARGEVASMRALANAAKMMETNPYLAKLRWIQALETQKGATISVPASLE